MLNHKLNETRIGTAKVIVDILPKGKVIPGTTIKPTAICLHQTGNIGAPAKNNHNYMKNCNRTGERIASWHFTCDDKEIWQAVPANYKCYHAGNATGNNTSIAIEICMFNDKERQKKAYNNAIELIKILMKYYGLTSNQVKRHYDYSKKHCPAWLIEGKWGYTWAWFKAQLTAVPKPIVNSFTVKIICDSLNIRSGPSTSYPVVGAVQEGQVFTIVETANYNNWGKLKSGAGWINISSKYVKKL